MPIGTNTGYGFLLVLVVQLVLFGLLELISQIRRHRKPKRPASRGLATVGGPSHRQAVNERDAKEHVAAAD
jgi:hypothetical protein